MFGLDDLVSVTMFNKGHASKIFDRVKAEGQLVVLKNNTPAAVIVSPEEYSRLTEAEENYYLLTLAEERLKNSGNAHALSEKEAMTALGMTEADIDAAEEVDIV